MKKFAMLAVAAMAVSSAANADVYVHGKGSIATTDEILTGATGVPLGAAAFKAHLESRYLPAL